MSISDPAGKLEDLIEALEAADDQYAADAAAAANTEADYHQVRADAIFRSLEKSEYARKAQADARPEVREAHAAYLTAAATADASKQHLYSLRAQQVAVQSLMKYRGANDGGLEDFGR